MFYKLSLYIELFLIAFLLASIIAARGPVFWDDGKEAISLPCIEIHIDNISPLQGHDMIEDYYSIIISQGKNFYTPLHPNYKKYTTPSIDYSCIVRRDDENNLLYRAYTFPVSLENKNKEMNFLVNDTWFIIMQGNKEYLKIRRKNARKYIWEKFDNEWIRFQRE